MPFRGAIDLFPMPPKSSSGGGSDARHPLLARSSEALVLQRPWRQNGGRAAHSEALLRRSIDAAITCDRCPTSTTSSGFRSTGSPTCWSCRAGSGRNSKGRNWPRSSRSIVASGTASAPMSAGRSNGTSAARVSGLHGRSSSTRRTVSSRWWRPAWGSPSPRPCACCRASRMPATSASCPCPVRGFPGAAAGHAPRLSGLIGTPDRRAGSGRDHPARAAPHSRARAVVLASLFPRSAFDGSISPRL